MATLFGRMRSISRGAGSSAMTAAAYRSCSQLTRIITDSETGIKSDITYDYTGKKGLVFSEIFAPDIDLADGTKAEIPAWVFDRQNLWQRVEDIETRVNSELAKEYVVALPKEFTEEQNIEFLREFVETSFLSRGMVVDVNYHGDNPENPHAHIMFPMRMLELNEQGEIDFSGKIREWKSFAMLNQIKQEQQIIINDHYAKNGFEFNLQWGTVDGLEATFHHGGIKNLWLRNQEILERNASRIIADPSLVIDKLDHNKSAFTSEDIEKEIENALQINVRHIKSDEYIRHKESLDIYLQTEKLKMLDTVLLSPKLTVINSCDLKGRTLFAKTKQVELEQRFVAHIENLHSKDNHAINIAEQDIKPLGKDKEGKRIEFTQQQKEVIRKTLAGRNISIIEGWPGAGKTTVTKEIVRHYQKLGYTVMAAAPTNKAAQELEDKLGIKAYTAAALRMKWQFKRGYKTDISLRSDYYKDEAYQNTDPVMKRKTVLIVDEISMIDTPTFDYFAAEIARSNNKLIGLGDNNQNQAIGMKGSAAKVIDIAGSNLLTEINRHSSTDMHIRDLHIEASTALSRYQVPKALSIYEQLGAIKLHENEELKEQAIFSSYMEKLFDIAETEQISVSNAASKIGMVAYTNAEIDRLNVMVRDSLKRSGILASKGNNFLSGGLHGKGNMVELCEGDRIIFKSNQIEEDGYGGVMNNEIATIRKIISGSESGKGEFIADINRNGKVGTVAIKTAEEGRPISFRHAYAITNYAVQGSSIDHILMSMDKHSGYEVTLVGLTRHKLSCEIFAALDTLENEVYRTKDLDVNKVRAEFDAISYKWVEKNNNDGKPYFKKEDLPLWKLGLGLLASKRTDLNFAIDYSYGNNNRAEQDKLAAIYAKIGRLRGDLDKHTEEIYKFELQANSHVELEGHSEEKATREQQPYSQMELFAAEHFKLEAGDVMFDVRSVMKSPLQYEQINSDEISARDHAEALKTGILKNGARVKLTWNDLSELDQNLVLHSYLDKEDKEQLSGHIKKVEKLEEQIKQVASEHIGVFAEMSEHSKSSHKRLTGNYGAVRDYLEARTSAREGYQIMNELNASLNSLKMQKLLISSISAKYKVNFQILPTKIDSIIGAEKKFNKHKEEFDSQKQEGNPNFKPETDINKYRQNYLRNIANKKEAELNQKNLDLFLYDVLSNTKNKELSDFWKKAETTQSELDKALEARQSTALALINNYHQGIQSKNKQPSIGKLLAQLSLNYQTIAKHARVSDERHYFKEIAKGSARADEHYSKIMGMIEKAADEDLTGEEAKLLLESHYELAVSHELIGEYLSELKLQRSSVIEQHNEETKLLQKQKLFRTTEFNSYIGQIYKTNRLDVIENFDKLLQEAKDRGQLLYAISQSPEMIGELKDRGLIAQIFKAEKVRHVDEKLGIFGDNLRKYVEGYEKMEEIQNRLDGKYFQQQLNGINLEISKLQAQLASSQESELLTEIGVIEAKHMFSDKTDHSKFDELGFASSVSSLFREDKSVDLLFDWQGYQAKLAQKKASGNLNSKDNNYHHQANRLDFNEVTNALSDVHYEAIFRNYATNISNNNVIVKNGNSIMCGSLHMNLDNGLWIRFSKKDQSGNIYSFVAHAVGCDKKEALEIVADIAGVSADGTFAMNNHSRVEEQYKQSEARAAMKEEWKACGIVPGDAPKFEPRKHLAFKLKENKVAAIYEYRNVDNELIGYAVRLEDKKTSKKQVLPVAYCYNEEKDKYIWKLKGFTDNGHKAIYGAEKLHADIRPILIVEGEKAADRAQELLPEYSVISWMGGAKAVDKVNWEFVKGREVVIWPDNDQAGSEAANNLKGQIDNQNGYRGLCQIVDTANLALPEKWDLADKLPSHMNIDNIKNLIANITDDLTASAKLENPTTTRQRAIEFEGNTLGAESEASMIEKIKDYTFAKLDKLELDQEDKNFRAKYTNRLEAELKVIEHTGFSKDFILAHQICDFTDRSGIMIGTGRGSAVGSLTAYLLGIHKVDPIKYDLSFERFLTLGSKEQPDFDIDIAASEKEIVEDYLFNKYPEAAKLEVVNKNGKITTHPAGIVFIDDQTKSTHGILINHMFAGDKSSNSYFARAALDKEAVKPLKIRKVDLLSSNILDQIKSVEVRLSDIDKKLDWQKINWSDQKVFARMSQGDLEGVYQFNSEYTAKIVQRVGIKSFGDIVAMQALIRPGAKNIIEQYIANANGQSSKTLPELQETRGVILYQEQIMKLAENYLGIDVSESNSFRKDLAELAKGKREHKPGEGEIREANNTSTFSTANDLVHKTNFIKAVQGNGGLKKAEASLLYDKMLAASKYSFNKSHATAYAMLSFKTAYINTYHKELFTDKTLNKEEKLQKAERVSIQQLSHSRAKLAAGSIDEYIGLLSKGIERVRHFGTNVSAEQNKEYNQLINKIEQASYFLQKQAGSSQDQLLKLYKVHSAPESIHKALIENCRAHTYGIIKQQLHQIEQGKTVIAGGKKFTCQKSYLNHLHEHGNHNYLPKEQIQAKLDKIKHQEFEIHKQQQINGPGM